MTSAPVELLGDDWERPRPDRRGYRADAILALVLLALSAVSLVLYTAAGFYPEPAGIPVSLVCIAAQCLPLVARRRFPLVVLLVISVAFIITQSLSVPEILISNIALFVALYTAGAWSTSRRWSMLVRGLVILGMFVWLFVALLSSSASLTADLGPGTGMMSPYIAYGLISLVTNLLYFGGAYYFGDRAWMSAKARLELEQRSAELAIERERNAAQAVVRERLRIARDLHDVVAHHVSVMGVQAGAARRLVDRSPEKAAVSLAAIETSAREAVDELHRMLGTLREVGIDTGAIDTADIAGPSTHRLSGIPRLIADARSTGLDAEYSVIGDPRDLPITVESTLYRVAQEAITNTLKHAAPSARLDVRLRWLDGAVELEAADSGGAARTTAGRGSGLGLIGMRERVSAVGGTLETGSRTRGGFLVRARVDTPGTGSAAAPSDTAPDIDTAPATATGIGDVPQLDTSERRAVR